MGFWSNKSKENLVDSGVIVTDATAKGDSNMQKLLKTLKKKTGKKTGVLTKNEKSNVVQKEDDKDEIVPKNDHQPETSLEKLSLDTKEAVETYALDIEKKKVLVISKCEGNFDKDELIQELNKKIQKAEKRIKELMSKEAEESKIDKEICEEIKINGEICEKIDEDGNIYIQPSDYEDEIAKFSYIFSDANPNACSIS